MDDSDLKKILAEVGVDEGSMEEESKFEESKSCSDQSGVTEDGINFEMFCKIMGIDKQQSGE